MSALLQQAKSGRLWALAAAGAALSILTGDHLVAGRELSTLASAAWDEPAHALTAFVLLGVFGLPYLKKFWVAVLSGSVLFDVDHLPAELGFRVLTRGTDRPYSHSLTTVILMLLLASVLARPAKGQALALAVAFVAHLFRDLAEGASVPLLWPLTSHGFRLDYRVYAAVLITGAAFWLRRCNTAKG